MYFILGCTLFGCAYSRAFNDAYDVPFGEARVVDIFRELISAELIIQASFKTLDRYILVARLFMGYD